MPLGGWLGLVGTQTPGSPVAAVEDTQYGKTHTCRLHSTLTQCGDCVLVLNTRGYISQDVDMFTDIPA